MSKFEFPETIKADEIQEIFSKLTTTLYWQGYWQEAPSASNPKRGTDLTPLYTLMGEAMADAAWSYGNVGMVNPTSLVNAWIMAYNKRMDMLSDGAWSGRWSRDMWGKK
jgi:hypothetical protein